MAKDKFLAPIHPNEGVAAAYRKRLLRLTDEMAKSIRWFVRAAYRANEPAILAQDEAPADALRKAMKELADRWQGKFDEAAADMAAHFAKDVSDRSDFAMKAALKKAGFTVKFRPTPAQRDILRATINENVSLIKSIPAQYLTQVEGSVFRAVQVGGDLGKLTEELAAHHGVTRRRAANIARDQNNKANAALKRERQLTLGLDEEEWVHSGGGKHPRATHVKAGKDRVRYKIADGWVDPADGVRCWPGSKIGCRCTGRTVIKGL